MYGKYYPCLYFSTVRPAARSFPHRKDLELHLHSNSSPFIFRCFVICVESKHQFFHGHARVAILLRASRVSYSTVFQPLKMSRPKYVRKGEGRGRIPCKSHANCRPGAEIATTGRPLWENGWHAVLESADDQPSPFYPTPSGGRAEWKGSS